jgi:hypothetical protein
MNAMNTDIGDLQDGVFGQLAFDVKIPFLDRRRGIVERDGAGAAAGIGQARWRQAPAGIRGGGEAGGKLQLGNRIRVELNGLIAEKAGWIVGKFRVVLVGLQAVEDSVAAA